MKTSCGAANKIRIFHGTKNENDSQALTEKLCRTALKLSNKTGRS